MQVFYRPEQSVVLRSASPSAGKPAQVVADWRQANSGGPLGAAVRTMDYQQLEARQRVECASHHPNLALRVHRAFSWLHRDRAEQVAEDPDGQFIFLWIAFNAAYATEIDERYRLSEQETSREFLPKLLELDTLWRFEAALQALARRETVAVLAIVPSRVLTLRNQLMHGGVVTSSTPA